MQWVAQPQSITESLAAPVHEPPHLPQQGCRRLGCRQADPSDGRFDLALLVFRW